MNGCTTCGGFGMHHDPVAHGWPTAALRPSEPDPFSPTNHRDPREESEACGEEDQ